MPMRILTMLAACSVVLAVPAHSQQAAPAQPAAQTPVSSIQLVVWNRAGVPISLEVRLDEERVLLDELRAGNVATSIEAGRILQRQPGTYTLRVIDRTRGIEDSVVLRIDSEGQNLGIHLTGDGLAFLLTRGDVTTHTPPPSAEASK
jgi:hypothetical protein